MKLARKVKQVRHLRELSQRELAERAGVSVSTIVRLESGRGPTPRAGTIAALAKALGVSAEWLRDESRDLSTLFGRDEGKVRLEVPTPSGPPGGFPSAEPRRDAGPPPLLGREKSPISTSTGGAVRMAPVFDIGADFDRDWHDGDFPVGHGYDQRPAFNGDPSGFWCVLHGDSMEPELFEGDLLYFSPEWTRPRDGDICLIRTHEFATVKRVFRVGPTTIRLAAANPRYPDRLVDLVEDVVQLHRVVCFVRMLK